MKTSRLGILTKSYLLSFPLFGLYPVVIFPKLHFAILPAAVFVLVMLGLNGRKSRTLYFAFTMLFAGFLMLVKSTTFRNGAFTELGLAWALISLPILYACCLALAVIDGETKKVDGID